MKMKTHLLAALVALLAGAFSAFAQEDVWEKVKEVNMPKESLQASWHRLYSSPLLQEPMESEGTVLLQQPDQVRWETLKPIQRVTVLDGKEPKGKFRLPTERDFKVKVLEGDTYTVQLDPVRRDLKKLVGQISLTVEKNTYKLLKVTILGLDGDWTQIEFTNVVKK